MLHRCDRAIIHFKSPLRIAYSMLSMHKVFLPRSSAPKGVRAPLHMQVRTQVQVQMQVKAISRSLSQAVGLYNVLAKRHMGTQVLTNA
jgi:hypothetical protein